ncbi:hypothetical protein AVEN_155412-1 [Araneus ventricosus]|uniref:Uncharacterized protein n=1 Tax=Araneus ventricosus TaxID=182803 RepID=A0A4Y2XB84_ARAVE|nr:hypothetical protein AVEN_155412-1 [Araneus ventricosus]
MAGVTDSQASLMRHRRSYNVGGGIAYTCLFMYPHKKMSNRVKSDACLQENVHDTALQLILPYAHINTENKHVGLKVQPQDVLAYALAHPQISKK